jgi:hypothetical protein
MLALDEELRLSNCRDHFGMASNPILPEILRHSASGKLTGEHLSGLSGLQQTVRSIHHRLAAEEKLQTRQLYKQVI